jgi:hypothetical protein
MEYSVFKVEEKKDGRRNLFGTMHVQVSGNVLGLWQLSAFSLFRSKGIL